MEQYTVMTYRWITKPKIDKGWEVRVLYVPIDIHIYNVKLNIPFIRWRTEWLLTWLTCWHVLVRRSCKICDNSTFDHIKRANTSVLSCCTLMRTQQSMIVMSVCRVWNVSTTPWGVMGFFSKCMLSWLAHTALLPRRCLSLIYSFTLYLGALMEWFGMKFWHIKTLSRKSSNHKCSEGVNGFRVIFLYPEWKAE